MKRLLMILLALLLMIPAALAEGENTLLRHAVELGRELDALAEDEERSKQYTADPEILEMVRSYGAGSHDKPCEVRAVNLDDALEMMPEEYRSLPENVQRQLLNALPRLLVQASINTYGVKAVVANTILRTSVTFAAKSNAARGIWFLMYDDAAPVAVAWYAENGAVHMEASFMPEAIVEGIDTRVIAAARPALDANAYTLAAELQELAGNGQYLMLLGLPEEVLGMVNAYAAAENSTPRLVLCGLTDDAYAANVCLTQQIAYIGDVALAAVGAMHSDAIFADPDAGGTGLYLFLYEDGAPIVITWTAENGAYHLSAAFQPGEYPASCRNAEDVNAWAESIGLNVRFQAPGAMLLP